MKEWEFTPRTTSISPKAFSIFQLSSARSQVTQNYKMRTVTNTMVINHCLTDMLMVMSDVAFYITAGYIPSLTDSYVFCMLSVFFDSLFKVASFLSMVCIAFDRYHNLVRNGRKKMTKKRVALLIAWVWTQSSLVATPWNELIKSDTSTNTSACALVKTLPLLLETGSAFSTLSVVFKITSLLLPLLGIYCISFRIFSAGRTRRRVDITNTPTFNADFHRHTSPTELLEQRSLRFYCSVSTPFLQRHFLALLCGRCFPIIAPLNQAQCSL